MDLPIKFPSDTAVYHEEVARFRSLSLCWIDLKSIRGINCGGSDDDRKDRQKQLSCATYSLEQEERRNRRSRSFWRAMPAENDLLADDLIRAVELLADVFAAKSIRYAVVGGLATLMRGTASFYPGCRRAP